jgi:hypothetical protein
MKLSIAVTNYSWPSGNDAIADALREVAQTADQAGIDMLWVTDHVLQMDPNAAVDEPMLEAYTTLGYLAGTTTGIRLGTLVTWATIRPRTEWRGFLITERRRAPLRERPEFLGWVLDDANSDGTADLAT